MLTFTTAFDGDGKPVNAVVTVRDITASRIREIDAERNRLLLTREGVALFDYDVKTDTLFFEAVRKGEGVVRQTYKNYYEYTLRSVQLHPNSAETLREMIRAFREKPVSGTTDYMADNWGTGYRWCRIYYTSVADADGRVYRAVGQIMDIQEEKDRELLIEDVALAAEESAIVIRQSGKRALRYDIGSDTAENMLDTGEMFGLPWRIERFSTAPIQRGLVAAESIAVFHTFIADMRTGQPEGSYDLQIIMDGGETGWLHVDYSLVFDSDEKPVHAVISCFDNTELMEKEIAYKKWNDRLDRILAQNTPYLEVNITKDIVERYENLRLLEPTSAPPVLRNFLDCAIKEIVAPADAEAFSRFFDRKRMLALYYSGVAEDSLQYRATISGLEKWYRIDLQMVKYPYSDDVKAFVTFNDIDADVRESERLSASAQHDAMTSLLSRATLQKRVDAALENAKPTSRIALFMLDIDAFKAINDTYGHQQGDETIMLVGRVLREAFRENDLVGRVGGDEFMAFMSVGATDTVIRRKAEQLLSRMQFLVGSINISVSIGIATAKGTGLQFEQLYAVADKALYTAKSNGKNTYCVMDGNMGEAPQSWASIPEETVQLQVLLDSMEGGIIMIGVDADELRILYTSPSMNTGIHEIRKETGVEGDLFALVYAEDFDNLQQKLRESAEQDQKFDITFRVGMDGKRWMRVCGERMHQEAGGPVRLLGVLSDVTDMILAEEKKREGERIQRLSQYTAALAGYFDEVYELDWRNRTLTIRFSNLTTIQRKDIPYPLSEAVEQWCAHTLDSEAAAVFRKISEKGAAGIPQETRTLRYGIDLGERGKYYLTATFMPLDEDKCLLCNSDIEPMEG